MEKLFTIFGVLVVLLISVIGAYFETHVFETNKPNKETLTIIGILLGLIVIIVIVGVLTTK